MAIDVKIGSLPLENLEDLGELVESAEDYLAFKVALGC